MHCTLLTRQSALVFKSGCVVATGEVFKLLLKRFIANVLKCKACSKIKFSIAMHSLVMNPSNMT